MKLTSFVFAGLFTCCVFLSGCATAYYTNSTRYFPYAKDDFAVRLIVFLNDYPDMEVLEIVGTDVQGYFVVFKKKIH